MNLFNIFKKIKKKPAQTSQRGFSAIDNPGPLPILGNVNINEETKKSLEGLRNQARDLELNNPCVGRYLNLAKSNIIGEHGIKVKLPDNDELSKRTEDLFEEWSTDFCTVNGDSWVDFLEYSLTAYLIDGEHFVRQFKNFDNSFGYSLQFVESEYCDHNKNEAIDDNRRIKLGIELDRFSKPLAYYFHTENPYSVYGRTQNNGPIRISSDEIIHVFDKKRGSLLRGYPHLASVIKTCRHLDGYTEAELISARAASSKMGFFTRPDGGSGQFEGDGFDHNGNPVVDAEPGTFTAIDPGWKFDPYDPTHNGANFDSFHSAGLRQFSAGANADYTSVSNDLKSATFANARNGAMVDQAQQKRIFQKLVRILYRPIYQNWLEIQFLNGNIKAPISEMKRLLKAQYIGKKFTYYDFYKDIKAMELERKLGLKSFTKQLAEMGIDFEDHVTELKREDQLLKEAGLESLRIKNIGVAGSPANISDIEGELEVPPEEIAKELESGKGKSFYEVKNGTRTTRF